MAYLATQKERLKYLRKLCKDNGLTFKLDNSQTINGKACYMITDRVSGKVLSSNLTIDNTYFNEIDFSFISSKVFNDDF